MNGEVLPLKARLLVELHNHAHLCTVYGDAFGAAAMSALHSRAHSWGGSVVVIGENRFLIELLAQKGVFERGYSASSVVERWQLALSSVLVGFEGEQALLVVTVASVHMDSLGLSAGKLSCPQELGHSGIGWPLLAPVPSGWHGYLCYERDMQVALSMHRALVQGRASLVFQPVVRCDGDGKVLYEEALLRVAGIAGEPGMVPDKIVPTLERLGLVRALDRAVVTAVLDRLEGEPDLCLGCNLSACSLVFDAWWSGVIDRLTARPRVAARLTLEITETAPVVNMKEAVRLVRSLQALGCQIALDDFGAGYTPLSFAFAVQPQIIKIDSSLLQASQGNATARERFQQLVYLCNTLAPHVVVEGVATASDLHQLTLIGVLWGQGDWLGRVRPGTPPLLLRLPLGEGETCVN